MVNTLMKSIVLAAALAWGGGCIVTAHPPHGSVIIGPGHIHGDSCGHHFHRGRWYVNPGHHHRLGCGHVFRGGVWVTVD